MSHHIRLGENGLPPLFHFSWGMDNPKEYSGNTINISFMNGLFDVTKYFTNS